jgi:hypothetical protein
VYVTGSAPSLAAVIRRSGPHASQSSTPKSRVTAEQDDPAASWLVCDPAARHLVTVDGAATRHVACRGYDGAITALQRRESRRVQGLAGAERKPAIAVVDSGRVGVDERRPILRRAT